MKGANPMLIRAQATCTASVWWTVSREGLGVSSMIWAVDVDCLPLESSHCCSEYHTSISRASSSSAVDSQRCIAHAASGSPRARGSVLIIAAATAATRRRRRSYAAIQCWRVGRNAALRVLGVMITALGLGTFLEGKDAPPSSRARMPAHSCSSLRDAAHTCAQMPPSSSTQCAPSASPFSSRSRTFMVHQLHDTVPLPGPHAQRMQPCKCMYVSIHPLTHWNPAATHPLCLSAPPMHPLTLRPSITGDDPSLRQWCSSMQYRSPRVSPRACASYSRGGDGASKALRKVREEAASLAVVRPRVGAVEARARLPCGAALLLLLLLLPVPRVLLRRRRGCGWIAEEEGGGAVAHARLCTRQGRPRLLHAPTARHRIRSTSHTVREGAVKVAIVPMHPHTLTSTV